MQHDTRFHTGQKTAGSALPYFEEHHFSEVSSLPIGRCLMNLVEVLEMYPVRVQILAAACAFLLVLRRCRMHASELIELARVRLDRQPTPELRAANLYTVNQITKDAQ